MLRPLVNSKIPEIKPVVNFSGIFKNLNIGFNKFVNASSKLLFFKIEIRTENRTTKPPINKIVFIELVILLPIIPPRFDKETLSLEEL